MKLPFFCLAAVAAVVLTGCETTGTGDSGRAAMNEAIRAEQPGNYFVARRMYKQDYKVWGWVREPGKPWKTAKLVMLNEQRTLAPDRVAGKIGSDNGYEYKLTGFFSGATVYEPASDSIYPEFVLQSSEVRAVSGPNIFQQKRQNNPEVRILQAPM